MAFGNKKEDIGICGKCYFSDCGGRLCFNPGVREASEKAGVSLSTTIRRRRNSRTCFDATDIDPKGLPAVLNGYRIGIIDGKWDRQTSGMLGAREMHARVQLKAKT